MVRITKRDKEHQRVVARERIEILLKKAREMVKKDEDLARRYVELAVKIARKHRVRLGKLKYTFCRRCYTPWTTSTVRVRLVHSPYPSVVYKCLHCGQEYRIPLVREKHAGSVRVRKSNSSG